MKSIRKNQAGSTIIEFALVAPLFFLLVFGVIEFGLFLFSKVVIENISIEVGRLSSIGKTSDGTCVGSPNREEFIKCVVKSKAKVLINGDKTQVQLSKTSNASIAPDICFDSNPPTSEPSACKIFEEVNGTPGYQGTAASDAGGAGELIDVLITYPWTVQMPLIGNFFQRVDNNGQVRNVVMISAETVIKNEPFQ